MLIDTHCHLDAAEYEADRDQVAAMTRIRRLVEGDRGDRQARVVSYSGQSSRATPGHVRKDDREDGWETPERGDY